MKRSVILLFAVFLVVGIWGCRKDENHSPYNHVSSSDDLQVPEGFSFNTTENVSFKVSTNTIWGKEKIRVDIYDMPPSAGGELLFSGFADGFGEVTGNIDLTAGLNRVFVELTKPDGNSEQQEVNIRNRNFNCQFGNPKRAQKKAAPISPSCNAGCVLSLPGHSGNSVIKTTDQAGVYCFSGNITGSITARHPEAIVRLCGNAQLSSLVLNNGASLEIAEGAVVKVTNLELNAPGGHIKIYNGRLETAGDFVALGTVINYGRLLVGGGLAVKGIGEIRNYGEITVDEDLDIFYRLQNYHQLQVNQNFSIMPSGVVENHCRISSGGDVILEGQLTLDGAFFNGSGLIDIPAAGQVMLKNSAMMRSLDLTASGTLLGESGTSLVKVNRQSVLNAGAVITGPLELCDPDGLEVMNTSLGSGAKLACAAFIPRSSCNPEGNGQSNYADTDNDGVRDLLDRYPTEAAVSGMISYPSHNTYATLAFEDLWPEKGDYDFNDLVLRYRHNLAMNADNKVTRVETEIFITAVGSGFNKGFGFQFNLAPGDIASVSGQRLNKNLLSIAANGTENGQSKAVIMAFDHVFDLIRNRPAGPFINTEKGVPPAQSDTVRLVIELASPKTLSDLGTAPFNPFIYISDDRGKELHLIDQPPTDLVNNAYLGSLADRSDAAAGKYYVTENNQPWVLNVMGDFAHPLEKTDILDGYLFFDIWAQTGGNSNKDWHVNQVGYRNRAFIYD